MPKPDVAPELLELMADLILKVMKRTKGYCGISDLVKELRAADAKFTYEDVLRSWVVANHKAKERALKITRLKRGKADEGG